MPSGKLRTPLIVSFSGIDGAGKTTQIQSLASWLESAGLKVTILSMWDDVVACRKWRETASRHAFRGDQGIGTPEHPLLRRDKNVQSRPLNLVRYCLYFADALSLRLHVRSLGEIHNSDVVIFDRYIYDELANLHPTNSVARKYAQLLLKIAPEPDIAYIIDAEPEAARLRKPEYPVDFLRVNRESFLALSRVAKNVAVVATPSIEQATEKVREAFLTRMPAPLPNSLLPAMRG